MHAAEFPLLTVGEFGPLTARFPLGAGDGLVLARAHADEISFELGEGGEYIEERLFHGKARVVERPVELRHDQRVPFTHGGNGQPARRHRHPLETVHLGEAVRQRKLAGLAVKPKLLKPIYCSPANTGGQSANSSLSVRFCPLPESTRDEARPGISGHLAGEGLLFPDPKLLEYVVLGLQVPGGVVGLADPGVAVRNRDDIRHIGPYARLIS